MRKDEKRGASAMPTVLAIRAADIFAAARYVAFDADV